MNNRWITLGLSLLGVGGVGLTSWLSVKCYEKAKTKKDKKEKLIAYAPAIVSGLGTSACILGSHHISNKEIAALTASCAYLASNREKIESKIKEKFGQEKLQEVKKEVGKELTVTDQSSSRKGICYEKTGKGNVRFLSYDQGRYFLSSLDEVQKADRMINHMCSKGIIPTWNDYYDLLGIQNTRWGEEYIIPDDKWGSWNIDKPVEFEYIEWNDEEGKECYIIYTVGDLRRDF